MRYFPMVWPRKNIFAEYTHPVPPRFYVPEAHGAAATCELPPDEAAHLTRVLRATAGDRIRAFNGRGDEWEAEVAEANKTRVVVRLLTPVTPAPEPRIAITLAAAVLKGEKMDDIVRDAVMLGVTRLLPLVTTRTALSPATLERSGRIARWQRIAVASAKQCGRAVVPEVARPVTVDHVLSQAAAVVMLVEPAAAATAITLAALPRRDQLTVVVGPEGGWTDDEVRAAREQGAMLLTLGALTLRADAVPIVALTALRVRLEDF